MTNDVHGEHEELKTLKALIGTGCNTVEELRKKCDWLMDGFDPFFNNTCRWCGGDERYQHSEDGCEFMRINYEARLK